MKLNLHISTFLHCLLFLIKFQKTYVNLPTIDFCISKLQLETKLLDVCLSKQCIFVKLDSFIFLCKSKDYSKKLENVIL